MSNERDIIEVQGIIVDELGNWIDKGTVYYNNNKYIFDNYYYDNGYIMIKYLNKIDEEGNEEYEVVGEITHYLLRVVELESNVSFIEDIDYEYCLCSKCNKLEEEK